MKPGIGAWLILSLSIAQLSGATLDTHDDAATTTPNATLAKQGDGGEDIIDLDSTAAETPDSGSSNNIVEKVTERLKAETAEEINVAKGINRESSTHRAASVTSDDGRTTQATNDEVENEEIAHGGEQPRSKSDHIGTKRGAWGEEVAKLAHAREAKGEGVRDASGAPSAAGTEQAISSTIDGSPVVDAKQEEDISATIKQVTSEPADVSEGKNSMTDAAEGELANANDDVGTTVEDEGSTKAEPDVDPGLGARNDKNPVKEEETRQEEAIDTEERASYAGEEAQEEGAIDSTKKEVKEEGIIDAKEEESQEGGIDLEEKKEIHENGGIDSTKKEVKEEGTMEAKEEESREGAIDLEEKNETHEEGDLDADAGQSERAATAADTTYHSTTNAKAEEKDVSEDDGAKPSEVSDTKPGATAESSQTVSEQEEHPAAGDPDGNPSETETDGLRERVNGTSLENDSGQPQTSEASSKESPNTSPIADTNTRNQLPSESTTPGDPPEPPTPKKGSLAEFFRKVNKDPTKDAMMDFVATTAGNTEDESEHKSSPAAKEEDPDEYGYTTVWGAKRKFQLDKPLLDELFERSSTVVTETGSAAESDSSSTNAVPKTLDGTKNVETVDNATQLPKSVNTEFVEGLDDIDKFLEEVDPPDELDVGAAGSSMQDVLIGQGARIVLKRALMVLSRIRSSLHVARIKEFWSSRRNEEGQFALMKREEMERTLKQMRILLKGGLTNVQEFWEGLFDDDDDDLRFEMDLQQEESKLDSIRQRLLRQETEMPDPMETFKKQKRPA